jgi:death-on-curing protein
MSVEYLTADQIVELHRRGIAIYGGADGLRSEHQLLSAVFQPQQSAFGEDAYPTIPEKAAAYAFFLAEGQPFMDGNKRTGAAAMLVFLDVNGWEFAEDDDAIADAFEKLGRNEWDQQDFFAWVAAYAVPVMGIHIATED